MTGPARRGPPGLRELADQPPGDRRGEQCLAGGDHADRLEQPLRGGVLEQETARARPQRVEDVLVQVEGGQDEHLRRRSAVPSRLPGELPRRLDPVGARHPHVHQHHVGPQLPAGPHRLAAVAGRAEHGEVRLRGEQRGEPRPDHLVVVGDQDPDRLAHPRPLARSFRRRSRASALAPSRSALAPLACSALRSRGPACRRRPVGPGSTASTRNPPPGAIPVYSDPPTENARSRMPSSPCPPEFGRSARAWPVVPHPQPQHVRSVTQLDVDGRARRRAAWRWSAPPARSGRRRAPRRDRAARRDRR